MKTPAREYPVVTFDEIVRMYELKEEWNKKCRSLKIVKMLKNGIEEGLVPITGFDTESDGLRHYRGTSFFSFEHLGHCIGSMSVFRIYCKIHVHNSDTGQTRTIGECYELPVSLLVEPDPKVFDAWAKERRAARANILSEKAEEATARAKRARAAIETAVTPHTIETPVIPRAFTSCS